MIAGKAHSHSPILRTKGALGKPVILTCLSEQICILTKFRSKGIFKAWRTWACRVPWLLQVQFLTKLDETSKQISEFTSFSIESWVAKCPQFDKNLYKARHAHKHLCMVLPVYSKIQVLPGITSCRLMKDNKPAVDLNDFLKNTYAKAAIEKWLNSDC